MRTNDVDLKSITGVEKKSSATANSGIRRSDAFKYPLPTIVFQHRTGLQAKYFLRTFGA